MIYMSVCGCDGIMYSNWCLAVVWSRVESQFLVDYLVDGYRVHQIQQVVLLKFLNGSTTFCEGDSIQF